MKSIPGSDEESESGLGMARFQPKRPQKGRKGSPAWCPLVPYCCLLYPVNRAGGGVGAVEGPMIPAPLSHDTRRHRRVRVFLTFASLMHSLWPSAVRTGSAQRGRRKKTTRRLSHEHVVVNLISTAPPIIPPPSLSSPAPMSILCQLPSLPLSEYTRAWPGMIRLA